MKKFAVVLAAPALALALTACGSDSTSPAAPESSVEADGTTATQADAVTVADPWIKAAASGEMTAAFATLTNTSDSDVTVVSAAAEVSDMVQLHETVMSDGEMKMQEKDGGFVIAAGQEAELAPGGNHIMFMDLNTDLEPGAVVTVALTFDDGSTLNLDAVVKDYSGANEDYDSHSGMDGM